MGVKQRSQEKDTGKAEFRSIGQSKHVWREMEKAGTEPEGTCKVLGIYPQATKSYRQKMHGTSTVGTVLLHELGPWATLRAVLFSRMKPVREAVAAVILSF